MTSRRSAQFRSLAAYAAAPVFGLATGPILARALGPAGRGELAGMLQPLTVAAGVAAMGVPVAVAYHVARGQGNRSTLMRGLVLAATPALATYFALLAYGVYVANQGGLPIWVYAIAWLSIIPTTAQNTIRAFWRGRSDWKRLDLERILGPALRLTGIATLAVLGVTSAVLFGFLHILAMGIVAVVLLSGLRRQPLGRSPNWGVLARHSLFSWPAAMLLFAGARADQALMAAASTPEQLGLYSVAVTTAEVPLVLVTLIVRESLVVVAKGSGIFEAVRESLTYWLLFGISCAALYFAADWLIPWMFGSDFQSSVSALHILMLGVLGGAALAFSTAVLQGAGLRAVSSLGPTLSVGVTVLCFWHYWGEVTAIDAAWITAASQWTGALAGTLAALVLSRRWRSKAPASNVALTPPTSSKD